MLGILKIKNKRGPKNPNRKGRGKTWEKGLEVFWLPIFGLDFVALAERGKDKICEE
jgi:hypothetical protein